jgi:tyrosyl-tRNA synthetase
MLPGLLQGQEKMSKSDPNSAIFMEDSAAEVATKIKKAFCPPGNVDGNPCMEYARLIVFPWFGRFDIPRFEKSGGGSAAYTEFADLASDYLAGSVHPGDLKPALAAALNAILEPVRAHFANDARAADLLKRVKGFKVTK